MLILPALLAAAHPASAISLRFSPPVRCNATGPCPPAPPAPPTPSPAPSADDEGSGELGAGPIGSACTVTEVLGCYELKGLAFTALLHDRNSTFDQSARPHLPHPTPRLDA